MALDSDGKLWVAWHSYRFHVDRIMARRVNGREVGDLIEVSETAGLNAKPAICRDASDGVWVLWSGIRGKRWHILARHLRDGPAGSETQLSRNSSVEYAPAATTDASGCTWAAWVSLRDGRHQIIGRCRRGQRWSEPVLLSHGHGEHFRPVLCANDEGAWLAYETCRQGMYELYLRKWTRVGVGRPIKFSMTDSSEMFPRLCTDGEGGVWATWTVTRDVANAQGVVDHKVEIMASHFDGRCWTPYRSPDQTKPHGYVAHLYDGLLGRKCYMGFVGRRRRPQIVREDGGDVWVLYERKEDESVNRRGPDALFYGRPLTGTHRGRAFEIDQDVYAYTVSGEIPFASGRLPFAGQLPSGKFYADICAGTLCLNTSQPVRERPASDWQSWKPIRLPEAAPAASRPTMKIRGKSYKLYWGDLHCHGNFSGDAEGEIDENYAYGRYKSRLDFMAVADNDFIYDNALTTSEWALLRAEAAHFNDPAHFLAFSAYERSYSDKAGPNHRLIVFPDDEGPLCRWTEPDADTLDKFVAEMEKTNAFEYAHHASWWLAPCSRLGGAETCSSWGVYLSAADTIPQGLRDGYRLAFIGSSDTHRIVPGLGGSLMGIWAEGLTRKAIFEALWARRCFATTGERMMLDVRMDGAAMGSETKARGAVSVECRIKAPRSIHTVRLFRDGEEVAERRIGRKEARFAFTDRPEGGDHFYYVEVALRPLRRKPMPGRSGNLQVARGDVAWSSPIWVQVEAGA